MASSFQSGSSVINSLVTLSLHKFSYATSPNLQSKLLWTHLPERDNLFAVFDHIMAPTRDGLPSSNQLLKIVRGGDIIEQINLDHIIHQSRLDEMRPSPHPISDATRKVVILVKKPLIAIRYQLPDGQIRRMQMNFSPATGFVTALDRLSVLGLPIRDKTLPQDSQVQPSQLSGVSHSSQAIAVDPSASFISQPRRTDSLWPSNNTSITGLSTGPPSRPQTSVQRNLHLEKSSDYRPYSAPSGLPPYTIAYEPTKDPKFAPRDGADPSQRPLFYSDHDVSSALPTTVETLTQMLPPKRELPFAKQSRELSDGTYENDATATVTEPTTSDVNPTVASVHTDLKTSQKPKLKSKPLAKTRKQRPTTTKKDSPPMIDQPASASLPSADTDISNMAGPCNHLEMENDNPRDLPKKPAKRAAAPRKLPRAPVTKKPSYTTRSFATQTSPPPQEPSLPNEGDEWVGAVDTFMKKFKDKTILCSTKRSNGCLVTQSMEEARPVLKDYAARSPEERKDILEGILCNLIMEPTFETLLNDIDASWKKIGLVSRDGG